MTAPEIWFYHLESQPLHAVLPVLVEKTLNRGWRAILRFSTQERLEAIDGALWTYREESFLPHGAARDGYAERQPVFLTTDGGNPNGAHALFLLEAATESEPKQFARIIRLFDGADGEARGLARQEWKDAKAGGFEVSYWRQDANGAWKKSA
jgi:DNA polymerase-3 subunit chi